MKGKNAIITGARSGIGFAIMQLLAQKGVNCWAVTHRKDKEWDEAVLQIQKKYCVNISPLYIELENQDSIKAGVLEIRKSRKQVDFLINSAGYVSPDSLFTMSKMDEIRKVMEINFFAPLFLSKLVSRLMIPHKSGAIVNIASIAAWCEDTSQLEYACSKSALITATRKMAAELGTYNIRVNAIAPGQTETSMIDSLNKRDSNIIKIGLPLKRFAYPDEIAQLCYFLLSEESQYITGETFRINGGGFDLRTFFASFK